MKMTTFLPCSTRSFLRETVTFSYVQQINWPSRNLLTIEPVPCPEPPRSWRPSCDALSVKVRQKCHKHQGESTVCYNWSGVSNFHFIQLIPNTVSPCRFPGHLVILNGTTNILDFRKRPWELHPCYLSTPSQIGDHGFALRHRLPLNWKFTKWVQTMRMILYSILPTSCTVHESLLRVLKFAERSLIG